MKRVKVVSVDSDQIEFEGAVKLQSYHLSDCCESHDLTLSDLTMSDFEGLEFDLTGDGFFKRIPDYGIELVPIHGHTVKIPGHGYNNGYYSDKLELLLIGPDFERRYDITECQIVKG